MPNDEALEFQCPKCGKRLKAAISFAGRRVKCPKCDQPVKVPGIPHKAPASMPGQGPPPSPLAVAPQEVSNSRPQPAASSEDEWLNLGGPAISDLSERQRQVQEHRAAKEQERISKQNRNRERAALPSKSASSPAKRSIFDDDLPELSELQPTTRRNAHAEKLLAEHGGMELSKLGDLSDANSISKPKSAARSAERFGPKGPAKPSQAKSEYPPLYEGEAAEEQDPEYRIECTACGTAQYVRLSSKGMRIKCPDCFLQFSVPGPPPGWSSKKKKKLQLTHEDMPLAAEEQFQHTQTLEAQRTRASKILERAQQEVSEEELDRLYDGDFDTAGFVQRTFGFLKDPIAIAHLVGYGIVFAGIFAFAQLGALMGDGAFGRGLLLLTAIGGPLVGLLFAMPMLSSGIAVLEAAANCQKRVTEWPGFNLFENSGDMLAITLALVSSMVPGFIVGAWLGGEAEGAGRITICGMMISSFAMFPVVLLSMLDNGSVFAPLSNSVLRSFAEAAEAWAGYYLKTFSAFSMIMLLWLLLLGGNPVMAGLAGSLLPLLVFFTCQQMGALAHSISEHLSIEFVPPEKNAEELSSEKA